MTSTRLWDRAAALPVLRGRPARAEFAALPSDLPTVAELFDFMRDAEPRFATLRMRIEDRTLDARGERRRGDGRRCSAIPARPRCTTAGPGDGSAADYEVWISDGELVRTYASAHRLGTQRPIRNRPRGLDDPDLPGTSKVYEPVTALPDGDPARHVRPPGRLLPERAGDRALPGHRHRPRRRSRGDPARVRPPTHDRAARRPPGLPHLDRGRSRRPGSSCAWSRSIGGESPATPRSSSSQPDVPLPPAAFDFVFPTGTTMLY